MSFITKSCIVALLLLESAIYAMDSSSDGWSDLVSKTADNHTSDSDNTNTGQPGEWHDADIKEIAHVMTLEEQAALEALLYNVAILEQCEQIFLQNATLKKYVTYKD